MQCQPIATPQSALSTHQRTARVKFAELTNSRNQSGMEGGTDTRTSHSFDPAFPSNKGHLSQLLFEISTLLEPSFPSFHSAERLASVHDFMYHGRGSNVCRFSRRPSVRHGRGPGPFVGSAQLVRFSSCGRWHESRSNLASPSSSLSPTLFRSAKRELKRAS